MPSNLGGSQPAVVRMTNYPLAGMKYRTAEQNFGRHDEEIDVELSGIHSKVCATSSHNTNDSADILFSCFTISKIMN